ncbi:hypothetical protein HYS91_04050 [Candidatus Daviesbacteria bacterium]|nr:hypothetical protein [Candidatus Daviesbacteria bacterium]
MTLTVSCYHGESTFDIEFHGSVKTKAYDDGVWGIISGGNPSPFYFLYQSGNYPNSVDVGGAYNDHVGGIRGQGNLQLSSTLGSNYEMRFYSAPFTNGTPTLNNLLGNVNFAADCQW